MAETKEQLATILPSAGKDREVKLHPLVLINISDHFTREKVRSKTSPIYSQSERVAGVLFGVQTGKVVDVLESFEMKYEILDSGVLQFDEEFLVNKKQQCKFFIIYLFSPFFSIQIPFFWKQAQIKIEQELFDTYHKSHREQKKLKTKTTKKKKKCPLIFNN